MIRAERPITVLHMKFTTHTGGVQVIYHRRKVMSYKLEKPYTETEYADFVVLHSHTNGRLIEETDRKKICNKYS